MTIVSLASSAWSLLVEVAYAQAQPPLPGCAGLNLYGCGDASNVLANLVIQNIAIFFLRLVVGLSVLFVVWAGLNMTLTFGDTGKSSKARWSIIYALGGLGLALMSQMIIGFVTTENYGQGVTNDFIIGGLFRSAVRIILTFLNVILALVVTISGIRMIIAQGKTDEFNSARTTIIHAVMGAILINASVTLVRIVATFFGV